MKNLICLSLLLLFSYANAQTLVTFEVKGIPGAMGQKVGIRGSVAPLSWYESIVLDKKGDTYVGEIEFPNTVTELEYKFVMFEDDAEVTWENTQNRSVSLSPENKQLKEIGTWNKEQVLDISKLEKIAPSLLLQDYELIETLVLEVHPGTYRYRSNAEIQQELKHLKEKFSRPLTHQEVYLAVSKMMAFLQCDHTKAGFNNQTKIVNSIIHYQDDKVPFTFQWLDDEMILMLNASDNQLLRRGTKILLINNVPVAEIKKQMMPYIGADGATDKNRVYKMEVNGYDFRYNAFDVFYSLLYPIPGGQISLEIQRPGKLEIETLTVESLSREKRFEVLASRYPSFPKTRDDMWSFEMLSDDLAKLTVNSFGLMGWKAMTLDYKAFLAKTFQELRDKQVSNLIIDIRENNGGNDEMAIELFSYLVKESVNYEREGRTRYLSFPEKLKPHIKTWGDNPWFYELTPKNKVPKDGYFVFKENAKDNRLKSNKPIFTGDLFLLTSSANTSLAFYSALRFKTQKLGTIIGEETGGNLNDINGGQIIFLTLPHSQVEIDSPVMGGFSIEPQQNTGVMPDISVNYTLEDLINKRDVELEEVMKQIEN